MKAFLFFALFQVCYLGAAAQEENEYKEPSKESSAYHDYRTYETIPTWGLGKIRQLIKTIKPSEEDADFYQAALTPKQFNGLKLREKFTYVMIYGESFSQICDAFPPIQDEHKKIMGYLPDQLSEQNWSDKQKRFLMANRDSVMSYVKILTLPKHRMGLNLKKALLEVNAGEMIPFIIQEYKANSKDRDLLTVLNLLMLTNKYPAFMTSLSYKKMYAKEYDYTSWIDFNKANEELILKRATDFYNERFKK